MCPSPVGSALREGAPAVVGTDLAEVDTPALVVDLDRFERNLDRMPAMLAGTGVALRPHAKTHKSPHIAALQVDRGSVGVCVSKVAEAEVMVGGGVADVLVANEVVGRPKLDRLAALARTAEVAVCVDDAGQVYALEEAAAAAGVRLRVLVEVEVGGDRCGVLPGDAVRELARLVDSAPHLGLGGLQGYHGSAQHVRAESQRREAAAAAADHLRACVELLAADGLACEVVSGGGTGTVVFDAVSGIYTEVQPGSYPFMDVDYGRNLSADGSPFGPFEQSLFVLTTVMSAARPGTAVVDAGHKSVAVDSGLPVVDGRPDLTYVAASDEHGTLAVDGPLPGVGEKLLLVPGHCDPTIDRHGWYVGVRRGVVEETWPVSARGASS